MSVKVRFTDRIASREGREAEVTPAAAKRLIDGGFAEKVGSESKPKTEAKSEDSKPTAKKTTKKAAAKKS